jgi:hypothetical protein
LISLFTILHKLVSTRRGISISINFCCYFDSVLASLFSFF